VLDQARNIAGALVPLLGDFASVVIDIVVITVLSIYFLANSPRIDRWVRTSAPLNQRERVTFLLDTLNGVVGGYIRGQVTLAVLVGLLVGLGMQFIFHLPYAVLLGVLAFVLEFIPFLGVLASGLACVLVGLTVGPLTAVLVLAYFVIIHVIEGDVVGPRIVGNAVGLHPAVSLIALIAGTELFGIWGALFAAPIAGVLQALSVAIWQAWKREHPDQFPGHALTSLSSGGSQATQPKATVPVTTPDVPDEASGA
jgi:predicted PurR-regulated permease PerM